MSFLKDLNLTEKRTFKLHLLYFIIDGVILGVMALNEFVILRTMNGGNIQVAMLTQLGAVVLIFSIFFNEILRRIKNKKNALRIIAISTRLPLLALFFFPRNPEAYTASTIYPYLFLTIFLIYVLANPLLFPTINLFLKNNYRHKNFGKLYSYSSSINKIVVMVVTISFGFLLDYDRFSIIYVYPLAGALGILSIFILSLIDTSNLPAITIRRTFWTAIKDSLISMKEIITKNRPYRDFEIGFMLYGMAWMITFPVISIFLADELKMNGASFGFYKNAYNILTIFMMPFFGKLIGKIDPRKFAMITFGTMMLHLILLIVTQYFPIYTDFMNIRLYLFLVLSYISFSVFIATMSLLWYIGSAYFCKDEEVSTYQAIHTSLTGVRGMFAPLLGIVVFSIFGYTITFCFGVFLLLSAISVLFLSYRKKNNTNNIQSNP